VRTADKNIDAIEDPNAANRKKDHIELALKSQSNQTDNRFYYEPILSGHPSATLQPIDFLGKQMLAPIWISSMTGGTEIAGTINKNLARACAEFGLGMGLGSTRKLLFSDEYFDDFNLRNIIGDAQPFYANLGIAQVEKLIEEKALDKIEALVTKLKADGIFLHINPFQEWLQPEGDIIKRPPLETIQQLLETASYKIIVKEVGQGMGYESLKALFQLPLAAIDFAAHGGTNFSKVELLRNTPEKKQVFDSLINIGHSAEEMMLMTNQILGELGNKALCKEVIISGGIQSFLDGYYLINKINTKAVYGQGSAFLKHARGSYEVLQQFVKSQIEGLRLANAFLKLK